MKHVIKLMLIATMLSGCVQYKYSIWPNGKQIQMGSYVENEYLQPALFCTERGKKITELNKKTENYYRTNRTTINSHE